MTETSNSFRRYDTETFREQLNSFLPSFRELVESKIKEILLDPYHYRDFGKGIYRGKKKVRLNRRDRLFFVVCEECRKLRHKYYNQCNDCDETPDKTVKFAFIIFKHKY